MEEIFNYHIKIYVSIYIVKYQFIISVQFSTIYFLFSLSLEGFYSPKTRKTYKNKL